MAHKLFPETVFRVQKSIDAIFEGDGLGLGMVRRKRLALALEREANRHSVELEYPGSMGSRRIAIAEAERRQQLAWDYAIDHIGKTLAFSPRNLAVMASMLVPNQRINYSTGFRVDDVIITGASHTPPNAVTVPEEMEKLIVEVSQFGTPLEKAIYAHFHIARVHPFMDGNGRVSRLVQNALLTGGGYFPLTVSVESRDEYIDALDRGVRDFNQGSRRYLREFSDFIVGRFNSAVDFYLTHSKAMKGRRATGHPLSKYIYK
jgi:prophage maintenance system killer protein